MKFYQEFLGYCSKWNALSSAKQGHFLRSNTCYSVVQVLDPGRVALKVLWSWQLPGLYMDGPGTLVLVRTASLCSDRGGNKVKMSLSLFESSIFFFFFFRKERSAGFLIHRIFCCCCQKGFFFFLMENFHTLLSGKKVRCSSYSWIWTWSVESVVLG